MKILLPAHHSRLGGIATVVQGLVAALPEALPPADELLVFGGRPAPPRPNVRWLPARNVTNAQGLAGGVARFAHEQRAVARLARGVDLVHLCDQRPLLLSGTPFLITLHDVFFLDRADWFPRAVVAYKRASLAAALRKKPAAIVCVSEYTRGRFLFHHPEAEERVEVIPSGLVQPDGLPEPAAQATGVEPYFLTVSTIEPRKNHLGLLAAFRRARREGLALRWKVAGAPGYASARILRALEAADGVDLLGPVGDEERETLYRSASFVAVPSHAEGFGYPPLEAMARGVPVVCSAGSALDEVAAGATVRVAADDEDGWVEALLRLAGDEAERERLRRLGGERAAKFTWPAAAGRYVELYHRLAASQ